MSIRRKGNRWEVRVRVGRGKRIEQTLPPTATRADARALETSIRRSAIDLACGRKPERLIDEALDQWVATGADKLKSWPRDLRYRFAVLREYTAGKHLGEIINVAEQIKRDGQKEGLTAPTINRYVALLRRVGNLCERWGWTDLPLGRRVVLLPEYSERHVYLTLAQVQRLAGAADAVTADMIRFAALTGLRLAEMLALQPDQIRDGLLILGSSTKSGRPRGIPLPPEAVKIAGRRLPWALSRDQLRDRFIAARKVAKLAHVHWHDLRHTYASWLMQAGQPITAVRDLLGHSSLAVTNRYSHLAPAHLVDAVATLPHLGEIRGKPGRKKKAA
ncbi:MAG: site-specific integrase [Sulfuritalea sp.]|nr:site-specific integrase [Sulfuritalea sp.]